MKRLHALPQGGMLDRILRPPLAILLDFLWPLGVYPRYVLWLPNILSFSRFVPAALALYLGYLLPGDAAANHRAIIIMIVVVAWFAISDSYDGVTARFLGNADGKGGGYDAGCDFLVIIAFHVAWVWSMMKIDVVYGTILLVFVLVRAFLQLKIGQAGTEDKKVNGTVKAGTAGKVKTTIDCLVIIPLAVIDITIYDHPIGKTIFDLVMLANLVTIVLARQALQFHQDNVREGHRRATEQHAMLGT